MAAQAPTATRKQLDELDALLQKMLGQPAPPTEPQRAAVETPPPNEPTSPQSRSPQFPPASVAFGVPPAVAFAASSPTTTAPTPDTDRRNTWSIDLNPRDGSSVLGGARQVDPQSSSSGFERPSPTGLLTVTTIPAPLPTQTRPSSASNMAQRCRDVPLLLVPVAWFSNCCDATLNSFGPIGRMFTSPAGRTLMGYTGLAMLTASAASAALAWVGWSW